MPILLLILFVGVLCYFAWRRATTTLTRNCRWRQDRAHGLWRCSYCGAEKAGEAEPRVCLAGQQ